MNKREVRRQFREAVFARDGYKCQICGYDGKELSAHHITDRNEMPNGGYVVENGITLCDIGCHMFAEEHHKAGSALPGFTPEELYKKIGSSKEKAIEASERL